jgi:hypothetical protein
MAFFGGNFLGLDGINVPEARYNRGNNVRRGRNTRLEDRT